MEPFITGLIASNLSSIMPAVLEWMGRRRDPQRWEQLIVEALDLEVSSHGGSLTRDTTGAFDARIPEGFRDLPGPTAVDIWVTTRLEVPGSALIERIQRRSAEALRQGLHSVLLVTTTEIADQDRKAAMSRTEADSLPVVILGGADLQALLQAHGEQLIDRLPDLALAPLRAALEAPETDWRAESKARLEQLRTTYRREGIVLVLGAGVSMGMGLPNWDKLVSGLFVSLITKQLQGRIDEAEAFAVAAAARDLTSESPLLSARYLRRGLEDGSAGDSQAFQRELSSALYRQVESTVRPSSLLYELGKLCVPLRTGPKIHAVITYNFDDMLEQVLLDDGVAHRSVYSGRQHPGELELPVFHAHGFLPRDVENFPGLEEGLLAFSEEGYHQLFRDPYHWTNVIQLQAFQQRTCLLVGLSLTDPNLRRLLEYATLGRDEPRHFVFMRRSSVADLQRVAQQLDQGTPVSQAAAEDFLKVHHTLQERVLRELGLQVVWFDRYDDMPPAVQSLRT